MKASLRSIRRAAPLVLACALGAAPLAPKASVAAIQPSHFADQSTMGTVSGTVTDSEGKPAGGVWVRLFTDAKIVPPHAGGGGGGGNGGGHRTEPHAVDGLPQPSDLAAQLVTKVKTDAQGKYTIADVKPGTYTYRVGEPATGYGVGSVTVEAGQTATLDVKLKPAAPH